jgi:hypothetical protein
MTGHDLARSADQQWQTLCQLSRPARPFRTRGARHAARSQAAAGATRQGQATTSAPTLEEAA